MAAIVSITEAFPVLWVSEALRLGSIRGATQASPRHVPRPPPGVRGLFCRQGCCSAMFRLRLYQETAVNAVPRASTCRPPHRRPRRQLGQQALSDGAGTEGLAPRARHLDPG